MRVPQDTVIHVEHLPGDSRRRLAAIIGGQAVLTPTAAQIRSWRRWAALAIAATIAAALGATGWTGSAALSGPPTIGALIAVALIAGATAAVRLVRTRALSFAPGCYLIGAYLVDARRPLLRVTPLARTQPVVRRWCGHHWLRFATAETIVTIPVGGRAALERTLTVAHADLIAYASALAIGDRVTARALDPIAEARDRGGVVVGRPDLR